MHEPAAHVCTPRTKPWVADTKVTEAGLKPASETGGADDGGAVDGGAVDGGAAGPLVGVAGGADEAGADPPADAIADVAGAAGDETAGAVDAAALVAGALPAVVPCDLLEQPAAAISATSVMAPALVVHEVVMRSRTQK